MQDTKNVTFSMIANEWLGSKKNEVKESSYSNYYYVIRKYLIVELGDDTLENMESRNYNEYIDELAQELSTKTVRDILVILKSILEYANENYGCHICRFANCFLHIFAN